MINRRKIGGYRKLAEDRLRRMATIEQMLEFDMDLLEAYADSVADERQRLTRIALGEDEIKRS